MGLISLSLLILLVWYLFVHLEKEDRKEQHKELMEKWDAMGKQYVEIPREDKLK